MPLLRGGVRGRSHQGLVQRIPLSTGQVLQATRVPDMSAPRPRRPGSCGGPSQGGRGAVNAGTDGSGTPGLIGKCDNASRVVKYVAIFGYRYSGVDLMGMGIHDTRVVADLTRHDPDAPDPEEPVVSDGTGMGAVEHQDDLVESVGAVLSPFLQSIDVSWELVNCWPRLFLQFTGTFDGEGTLTFLVSTDILGDFQVHSLSIVTPVEREHSEQELRSAATEMETQYTDFISLFVIPVALSYALSLGLRAIEAVASPLTIGMDLGTLLAMLAAWTVIFVSYLAYLFYVVDEGIVHPFGAATALATLLGLLFPGLAYALRMAWFMSGLWELLRPLDAMPSGPLRIGLWYAAIALVKVAVLVTCVYCISRFLTMGLENS